MKQQWTKLVEEYSHRACALELNPAETAKVLKPKFAEMRQRKLIDGFTCTVSERRVEFKVWKKEKTTRSLDVVICTDVEYASD